MVNWPDPDGTFRMTAKRPILEGEEVCASTEHCISSDMACWPRRPLSALRRKMFATSQTSVAPNLEDAR